MSSTGDRISSEKKDKLLKEDIPIVSISVDENEDFGVIIDLYQLAYFATYMNIIEVMQDLLTKITANPTSEIAMRFLAERKSHESSTGVSH